MEAVVLEELESSIILEQACSRTNRTYYDLPIDYMRLRITAQNVKSITEL